MKNVLLIFVLTILSIACQKDENIGPDNLLYQRWHLDRTMRVGDDTWVTYDTDGYYDTEYQQDGTLVYRKNGIIQTVLCCSASRYRLSDKRIEYLDFAACATALCNIPRTEATITILSDQLFELNDGTYITQYRSVK